MLKRLINAAIDHSFIVNLVCVFLFIIGTVAVLTMKRDLIPPFEVKMIQIRANLSGASAAQMEEFVTAPIEDTVRSFAGIERITSNTTAGNFTVKLDIFDSFDDVEDLHSRVESAVSSIRSQLPEDLENLEVENIKINTFWFGTLSLVGFDKDNDAHLAWTRAFTERLRRIEGMTRIDDRSPKKQVYVQLRPKDLARFRVSLPEIANKVRSAFALLPLGVIEKESGDIVVEFDNTLRDVSQVSNLIIKGNSSGNVVRLSQVAQVNWRLPPDDQVERTVNGKPSATIILFKDMDTDTLTLRDRLNLVLEKESPPSGLEVLLTGDGPSFIERQLNVLTTNAIYGTILVIAILYFFLGFKAALMTAIGMPLAYLATFAVLQSLGISIDIISVVGMILVLGILVDDAIIVTEQYSQHLEAGAPPREAAVNAVLETIGPVTGTVLTSLVAFMPLLLAGGGIANVLAAIPWVVIAALTMSWIECFFILPNHLAHFVKNPLNPKRLKLIDRLRGRYEKILWFSLRFRYVLVFSFVSLLVGAIWFASAKVPFKFDLRISSERLRVLTVLEESTSVEESSKKLEPIKQIMNNLDKELYQYIDTEIGEAWVAGEKHEGPKYAQFNVRFSQTMDDIEQAKQSIKEAIELGLESVDKEMFERIEVDRRLDGFDDAKDHSLRVAISGRGRLDVERLLTGVSDSAKDIKGFKSLSVDPKLFADSWSFEPNRAALTQYGLELSNLSLQIRGYVAESKLHQLRWDGENVNVYSYIALGDRLDFDQLSSLPVIIGEGQIASLSTFGSWKKTRALKRIDRENVERVVAVEVSYLQDETKKEVFQADLEKALEPLALKFPMLKFQVEDADRQASKNKSSMSQSLIYAIAMILFILALTLSSIVQPLLIGLAIPFGSIGVIAAFALHDKAIDIMAMVGVIGMAGVVVNDSLILVDAINRKLANGEGRQGLIDASVSRLRPILLTSITTLGGVFPMAYGLGGDSGFTKPLALSMGWGLVFATFLTLFLIPAMVSIQRDWRSSLAKRLKRI
ncbi:MAG: hypothetical protein CME71_00105 [Halobacteriovorax sp.]|nr:hypothetical protein [Halobacteriovorax sp.]